MGGRKRQVTADDIIRGGPVTVADILSKARGAGAGGGGDHPKNWHGGDSAVPSKYHRYSSRTWDDKGQRWRYSYNYSAHAKLSPAMHDKVHSVLKDVHKDMKSGFGHSDIVGGIARHSAPMEVKEHALKMMAGHAALRGKSNAFTQGRDAHWKLPGQLGGHDAHHAMTEAIGDMERHRPAEEK